jgi:hypothetical protein
VGVVESDNGRAVYNPDWHGELNKALRPTKEVRMDGFTRSSPPHLILLHLNFNIKSVDSNATISATRSARHLT